MIKIEKNRCLRKARVVSGRHGAHLARKVLPAGEGYRRMNGDSQRS